MRNKVYWSCGSFFPCDLRECAEHETAHAILNSLKRIPDAASVEDGLARMHWRFTEVEEALRFWGRARLAFPALPWNLLQSPAWVAKIQIPDSMPEGGI